MNVVALLFIVIVIAGLIYLRIKMPAIKGKLGEKGVAATLSFLPDNEYVVLNDLMLRKGNRSTQIDHIVISIHGIFIIETKNYKGWIFGNSERDYWTQNIWGHKYSLYNPIRQNQNHIQFIIKKFSKLSEYKNYIYPIVVFLNVSKLQLSGNCDCVIWRNELNSYIRLFRQNVMTMDQCHYIANLILEENILDKKQRKEHTLNVRKSVKTYETKVNSGICPRCGGRLVLRTGKYGDFVGCSNYPHCRYTNS